MLVLCDLYYLCSFSAAENLNAQTIFDTSEEEKLIWKAIKLSPSLNNIVINASPGQRRISLNDCWFN